MTEKSLDIPLAWQTIDLFQLQGILMVLGNPDVGKSTFSRFLYQRLCAVFRHVAYLDGDPGQSTLGPPGTMTLALAAEGEDAFPPRGRIWRSFVGSISPRGHMLQVLTGAARLTAAARMAGVQAVIYDSTGFVQPVGGGAHLKLAKIDLLRPAFLLALQQERELETLLIPLRRSQHLRVLDLPPSPAAHQRERSMRQAHRVVQYARYFANAHSLKVKWPQFAVFPSPDFGPNLLVALEDADGFTIGLGIVEEVNREGWGVILQTPLTSTKGVAAIRLGDMAIDLPNFSDRQLPFREKGHAG